MAQHTPGPWTFEPRGESDDEPIITGGKRGSQLVCTMPEESSEDGYTEAVRDANARLIAAAPELLDCLCEMVSELLDHASLGLNADEVTMLRRAEAAIALAKGE